MEEAGKRNRMGKRIPWKNIGVEVGSNNIKYDVRLDAELGKVG